MQPEPDSSLADAEAVRFVARYLEDGAKGAVLTVEEYIELFPACPERIREEYEALHGKDTSTDVDPFAFGPGFEERETPQIIGRYQVHEEIGRGGQSVVMRAWDRKLSRLVALKILYDAGLAEREEAFLRFQREAQVAARLDHPNICTVYDSGRDQGLAYIAMRLVPGISLAQRIRADVTESVVEGDVSGDPDERIREMVTILESVANAVHFAHEAGVIHRDLKPHNIMIQEDGTPVVLDFGLARDDIGATTTLTRTSGVFGTPEYMSPEQLGSAANVDRRTDVWALGVTLYEAVTLKRPFRGDTGYDLAEAILNETPRDPRELNPALSRDLAAVIQTCLKKKRDDRYATCLAMAEDLSAVKHTRRVTVKLDTRALGLDLRGERDPRLVRILAGTAAVLGIAFVVAVWMLVSSGSEADRLEAVVAEQAPWVEAARARDLVERERALWPRRASVIPAMDSWLSETAAVLEADLEETSGPATVMQRLAADVARLRSLRASVESRRAVAAEIERVTTSGEEARRRWELCCTDLGKSVELEPVTGLRPLGRDGETGLWEFWHPETGTEPRWDGPLLAGRSTSEASSGLVFVLITGDGAPFFISRSDLAGEAWQRLAGDGTSAAPAELSRADLLAILGRAGLALLDDQQVTRARAALDSNGLKTPLQKGLHVTHPFDTP